MCRLKLQYVTDLENYFELYVSISAIVAVTFGEEIIKHGKEGPEGAVFRGVAATGIVFAWLELIFIVGRYPIKGSQIGVMFFITIRYLGCLLDDR